MSLTLFAIIVDCQNPRRQADWWANALSLRVPSGIPTSTR